MKMLISRPNRFPKWVFLLWMIFPIILWQLMFNLPSSTRDLMMIIERQENDFYVPATRLSPTITNVTSTGHLRQNTSPLSSKQLNYTFASMNDSSDSPDPNEFSLKNLNFETHAPCGFHKCFFRLRTNSSVGYLVASQGWRLRLEWESAQYLQRKYNIRHLLLEPPQNINITKDLADQLTSHHFHILNPSTSLSNQPQHSYSHESTIGIQKVQAAPEPSLLFKCNPFRQHYLLDPMNAFISTVKDKDMFWTNLHKEFSLIRTLISEETWAVSDFQALIDQKGNMYIIDVSSDDVFQHPNKTDFKGRTVDDWRRMCSDSLRTFFANPYRVYKNEMRI